MQPSQLASATEGGILSSFPEHARLIGLIVTDWNTIESLLVTALSFAMGQRWDIVYQMIYALRNSAARIDVMEPAFMAFSKNNNWDENDLKQILQEARAVCRVRNKFAHAVYADSSNTLTMLNLEDGIVGLSKSQNMKAVQISELNEAIKRSTALTNRVIALMTMGHVSEPPKESLQ